MRIVDLFFAIPTLLVAIGIVALFGASATTTILALGIAYGPLYARLIRGAVVGLRSRPYVDASRVLGSAGLRLLRNDILPGVMPIALVQSTALLGYALLDEACAGLPRSRRPAARRVVGPMINAGRQFIFNAPWLTIIPGLAVIIAVFAINLTGDGLRDILDPRSSQRVAGARMTSPLDPDLVPASATPPGAPGPMRRESPDEVLVAPGMPAAGPLGMTPLTPDARVAEGTPSAAVPLAPGAAAPLLEVRGLAVEFAARGGSVRVVDDVSFSIAPGEIVGLVGESGSGKSVTMLSVLRLVPPPGRVVAGTHHVQGPGHAVAGP